MIHKSYTTNICLVVLCAILMANVALCDLYTHNPRGSINRNCERDANRRNANRLFDSQDNAAGGYACPRSVGGPEVKTPKMYYYEGSELYLEWTSQHSCGEHNNYCELVIQYMCNDTQVGTDNVYGPFYAVRDGIPTDGNDDATDTVTEATKYNLRYGVHEQFENYQKCTTRKRNFGLYIADRNIGDRAVNTRQNNGEKFGFECVEERDYYPYWHASPWVDVAVFTSNTSMCQFYQENSQNVAPRGECWDATKTKYLEHNNIRDCIDKDKTNLWIEVAAWGVAAPECLSSTLIAARDNYLGNSVDGEMARYKWTLPFISEMPYDSVAKKTHHENCVLRFRYNITTTETPFFMDARYNYRAADKTSITPIRQDPWESFGYQNELHMAVNTNQYGRTFEDRSYVFEIRERPTTVPKWVKIHNLNVRGKRGNIVNVFPSTEYDFVPNNLKVNTGAGDLVHIQFSGSDYNPNRTPNNAEGGPKDPAQGGYRADRNNIVQLDIAGLNTPRKYSGITMFLKEDGSVDSELAHKLAFAGQNYADNVTSCLSKTALLAKNGGSTAQAELDDNNCGKLANTPYGPYFDGGLVKMWASGKFYYMCTRNNNFSNRGQKAIMIVEGAKWSAAQTTAPSSMTLLIALSSVLILAFNMLF